MLKNAQLQHTMIYQSIFHICLNQKLLVQGESASNNDHDVSNERRRMIDYNFNNDGDDILIQNIVSSILDNNNCDESQPSCSVEDLGIALTLNIFMFFNVFDILPNLLIAKK